jgi:hypothetical protein
VDGDAVLAMEEGVVHEHVGMLGGGGAGLEVEMNNLVKWVAQANDHIGRRCDLRFTSSGFLQLLFKNCTPAGPGPREKLANWQNGFQQDRNMQRLNNLLQGSILPRKAPVGKMAK